MRLQIRQDDLAGFERAKDWLLDGFDRWLRDERQLDVGLTSIAVGDAAMALDWKFDYGDGHLGQWATGDVTEFLLGWCPRKLSVSTEDSVTIPGSVAALTDYLAARGLLAPGSSSGPALRATATKAAADFIAEMDNPANFGMAKSLFTSAAAHGDDLDDQDLIPPLPPVVLPPDAVIEESRTSAPVLAMFAKLAEFAGAGRQLTQSGNLRLADARELVELLGTGDAVEERVGGEVHQTRTSADLPVLRLVFTWAKKAGVVRVRHGKMVATKRGLALSASPAEMFDRALDVLLEAGPMTMQRHPKAWSFWPDVDSGIDSLVLPLLIRPYVERGPVPLAELAELAALALREMFEFDSWSEKSLAAHVGTSISDLMDVLELAGAVRCVDMPGADEDPAGRLQSGEVELTPAGLAAIRRLLTAAGFDAPLAGRWADASAEELLTGTDRDDWMSLAAEIDEWRQRRSPEQALAELAAAVRRVPDPAAQNIALVIMSEIGPELAEPYIRELASEGPAVRGFALCWLADHSMLDPKEVYDPADLDSFAYVLAHRLVTAGDEGLLACLAIVGGETVQVRVVGDLGKKAAPPTGPVLEVIGRTHPAKSVAKAARKALFVMRSRLANQAR
jgi:hypothetical protein